MHTRPNLQTDEDIVNEAIVNAAQILDLKQKDLTLIIGPKKTQISALFKHNKNAIHSSDTVFWQHAILFLRLFRSLYALLSEDPTQCQIWLKSYNYHLNAVPLDLAKQTQGLVQVVEYLDAMRGVA